MAFSTQKEFFHVPFMNDSIDFECHRACVKLKNYNSTIDDRCWAEDKDKQSKFVYDLVVCNTPIGQHRGDLPGSIIDSDNKAEDRSNNKRHRFSSPVSGYGRDGNLVVGDSVINVANVTLNRMEDILTRNYTLQKKLENSNDRLKTANIENEEIKKIMRQRYNPEQSRNLKKKIKQLTDSGKIDQNDETELMGIYNTIEDMNKGYDILMAENSSLKRLIAKQALRCNAFDNIKIDPELSSNVPYLQKQIENLRKEVIILRKMEDEIMKGKMPGEYDIENDINDLNVIIKERNMLRDKCKQLEYLESQIVNLQRLNQEATNHSGNMSDDLNNQAKYINDMENEIHNMQKYYEGELEKAKFNQEMLKCRCDELKEELMISNCHAQRADCLRTEIDVLRNELRKRDIALNAYDCQYQQLMDVVCELNKIHGGKTAKCCLDNAETQTLCGEVGEDLAFYTGATLEHIMKEIAKHSEQVHEICGCVDGQSNGNNNRLSRDVLSFDDCINELQRLKNLTINLQEQLSAKDQYCDAVCSNWNDELNILKLQNDRLSAAAIEQGEVLNNMGQKVRDMDRDLAQNTAETRDMDQNIQKSLQLVQEISDVALKNQTLSEKMNELSIRDAQKLIESLKRQLEELQEKQNLCLEENTAMSQELAKRGVDPEAMKIKIKKELDEQKVPEKPQEQPIKSTVPSNEKPLLTSAPEVERHAPVDSYKQKPGTSTVQEGETPTVSMSPEKDGGRQDAVPEKKSDVSSPITKQTIDRQPSQREKELKDAGIDGDKKFTGANKAQEYEPGKKPEKGKKSELEKEEESKGQTSIVSLRPKLGESKKQDDKPYKDDVKDGKKIIDSTPIQKDTGSSSKKPYNDVIGTTDPSQRLDEKKPLEKGGTTKEDDSYPSNKLHGVSNQEYPKSETDAVSKKEQPRPGPDGIPKQEQSSISKQKQTRPEPGKLIKTETSRPEPDKESKDEPKTEKESKQEKSKPEPDKEKKQEQLTPEEKKISKQEQIPPEAKIISKQEELTPEAEKVSKQEKIPPEAKIISKQEKSTPEAEKISKQDQLIPRQDGIRSQEDNQLSQRPEEIREQDIRRRKPEGTGVVTKRQEDSVKTFAKDGMAKPRKSKGISQSRGESAVLEGPESEFRKKATIVESGPSRQKKTLETHQDSPKESPRNKDYTSAEYGQDGQNKRRKHGNKVERQNIQRPEEKHYEQFVSKTATTLSAGAVDGVGLELELRKILDMFIDECGFCFCKCQIPKSRFYAICHKLYHQGLHTLDFKELAYMHKKIFTAAESILPGCLFNMIFKEMEPIFSPPKRQRCCTCRSTLCCDSTEEKLMTKVIQLENDIETAKLCLQNLKSVPSNISITDLRCEGGDYAHKSANQSLFEAEKKQFNVTKEKKHQCQRQ